jgi:hypothetical protein
MALRLAKPAAGFDRLAAHKKTCVLLCALLVVGIRLALLPWLGAPAPMAPDEFSQLLAAKTFAAGKWTNPAHPMWVHFEAPYVIHQPTYASKYPPGPPLIMALGIVLTGHPWAGVLLAAGLMCGAICWMLQGWAPARWALAGALLAVARYSLHHYWLNSYWGGSFGAFGGALVLGGLPRVLRTGSIPAAIAMGVGVAVLLATRPFEGLLFSLIPCVIVLLWAIRAGTAQEVRRRWVTVLAPMAAVVALSAVPYAYYNRQVTGDPFRLPYDVYTATYEPVPHFIFQPIRPFPKYNHAEIQEYFNWPDKVRQQRTLTGMVARAAEVAGFPPRNSSRRAFMHPRILTNILFAIALIGSVVLLIRDRKMRVPLGILGLMMSGFLVETWFYDHYAAPMTGLTFLLIVQAMRRVSVWRWRRHPHGRALPVLLVATAFTAVLIYASAGLRMLVERPQDIKVDRPRVLAQIGRHPGKHLIFVHFGPDFTIHDGDWIYNEPDIDSARIVWARDMGARKNAELLRYFTDRQPWMVYKDNDPARIYRGSSWPEASLGGEEAASSLRSTSFR